MCGTYKPRAAARACDVIMAFHGREGPKSHHAMPWASDVDRKAAKMGSMLNFFKAPPKPGRPPSTGLPAKKRGRPPSTPPAPQPAGLPSSGAAMDKPQPYTAGTSESSSLGKKAAAAVLGVKLQRKSYSNKDPDALQQLSSAVENWDNKTGAVFDQLEPSPGSQQRISRTLQHLPPGGVCVSKYYIGKYYI